MENEVADALCRFHHQSVLYSGKEASFIKYLLPTDGDGKSVPNHAMPPCSKKAAVAHEAAAVRPVTSPAAQEANPRIPAKLLSRVMMIL